MDCADGLVGGAAFGAGDAGDGEGEGCAGRGEAGAGHFAGGFGADRAVGFEGVGVDAEADFEVVGVGDVAAEEGGGGAGDGGEHFAEHAPGAGFDDGERAGEFAGAELEDDGLGEGGDAGVGVADGENVDAKRVADSAFGVVNCFERGISRAGALVADTDGEDAAAGGDADEGMAVGVIALGEGAEAVYAIGFGEADDAKEAGGDGAGGVGGEGGEDLLGEHWAKFAGGTGEAEDVGGMSR